MKAQFASVLNSQLSLSDWEATQQVLNSIFTPSWLVGDPRYETVVQGMWQEEEVVSFLVRTLGAPSAIAGPLLFLVKAFLSLGIS